MLSLSLPLSLWLIAFQSPTAVQATATSTYKIPTYTYQQFQPNNTNECNIFYSHGSPNYIYQEVPHQTFGFSDNGNGYIATDVYMKSVNGSSAQLRLYNSSAVQYLMSGGQRIHIDNDGILIYNGSCKQAIQLAIPNLYAKAQDYQKAVGSGSKRRSDQSQAATALLQPLSRDAQLVSLNVKVVDTCGNWVYYLPSMLCGGQQPIPACYYPFNNEVGTGTYQKVLPFQDVKTLNASCKSTLDTALGFFTDSPLGKVAEFGTAAKFLGAVMQAGSVARIGGALLAALDLPLAVAAAGVIAAVSSVITALGGKDKVVEDFCAAQYADYKYEIKALLGSTTRTVTALTTYPATTIRTTYTTSATTACPATPTKKYPTINFIIDGGFENATAPRSISNAIYGNTNPYEGNQYISLQASYQRGRSASVFPAQLSGANSVYRPGRPMQISFAYRMSSVDTYQSCVMFYSVLASSWQIPVQNVMDKWVATTTTVTLPSNTASLLSPRITLSCTYPGIPKPTPQGVNVLDIDKLEVFGLDQLYP